MTEQEYQDLLDRAAQESIRSEQNNAERCCPQCARSAQQAEVMVAMHRGFKAGAEWARRNPGPETEALRNLLNSISEPTFDDARLSWVQVQIDRRDLNEAKEALAKFDAARSEK